MSEEADPRECDETFESEEGDIEPYPEVAESSADLLERLRELEAENSALAVANESQRETYERCLDEVANHVVQALLNQKDLREECIKLKMRVFDLERQNRTLADLFQQKLQSQPSMVEQVLSLPFPEHKSERQLKGPDKAAVVHCEGQAESGADGTAGPRAPPTSMEALSPFFKKKAHILEVLRRLEETDPLKFYPSSGFSSYHDFSQPLMPTETITDPGGVPRPCKIHQSCCHLSCSDPEAHDYMNGEAELQEDHNQEDDGTSKLCMHRLSAEPRPLSRGHRDGKPGDPPPLMSADSYLHSLFKDVSQNVHASGEPEEKAALPEDSQSLSCHEERCSKKDSSFSILMQCTSPAREALEPVLTENMKRMSTGDFQTLSTGQVIGTEECCDEMEADTANEKIGLCASSSNMPVPGVSDNSQIAYIEQESNELICNRLFFSSNETSFSKKVAVESYSPAPVPQKNGTTHQPGPEKPKLALSPTSSSCRDEAKPSPISSPSRLLKFLKIPSIGERTQAANSVRLSPQLTRSSKIPCRNNNYEVYHSPVMVRKTTLNDRDRQPPSPKTDMYPATHSAPTSPPKPEDACSPTVKEISYSSHSAPKASRSTKLVSLSEAQKGFQNVFHYENVSDVSTSCNVEELPQYLDQMNVSHFLSLTQNEDPNEKQPKSPEEKVLSPHFIQQTNLSPTADTVGAVTHSDSDSDTESAAWYRLHNHHSLPISSASHKAQSNCNYSSMRQHDKGPADTSSQSSEPAETQVAAKKSEPPSIPKKPVVGKPPSESSHHLFKERLAALGKLKSAEDLQVGAQSTDKKDVQYMGKAVSSSNCEKAKTAEKQNDRNAAAEQRHTKSIDSLDGKPNSKNNIGGYSMKFPGPCQPYDVGAKSLTTSCSVPKAELETLSSRIYVAKAEGPKMKVCISSSNPDPPQVLRNYMKCNTSQNLPHNSKTVPIPQSSPTKVSSKSPSKPGQASSNPRGAKPIQDDRNNCQKPSPRSEDKSKLTASKKKTPTYAESLLPTSPRPSDVTEDKRPFVVGPQSSIEQKVMKGIEENMLKLQEQDRGQTSEVKQKASNGIASWFGLKKSKLPALNRKPEVSKLKLNMSSMGKDPKTAAKKKLEVESLNISKLMEKAEDLRKALEEERAYVNGVALNRQGRGHSCEVMMDQAQGQLAVMHSGVASDNFMQQLLNRVDERDTASFGTPHRRLSFDSKKSRPIFSHQKNGINYTTSGEEMEKGSDLVSKDVASHENLAESMNSQHFTGSGASMRTLDSGIGTFPLPDYASGAAGKSIPKIRPQGDLESAASHCKLGPMTRFPRKARTLERELSSLEEVNPCALYTSALDGKGSSIRLSSTIHEDVNAYEADMRCSSSKNWTFPNLKASAGPADVYLDVKEEGQPATHGTPFKRSLKPCGPPVPCEADPSSLPLPPQMGLGSRGKGQTPSTPEMSKDGGLEMMKDRLEEIISPSRPQALETPESLSDSLYDSLSSCGSQG